MGNLLLTVTKHDWLGHAEASVKASFAAFVQQHSPRTDSDGGGTDDMPGLVARWLEAFEPNLSLGTRVSCTQRKRALSKFVTVDYRSEEHIASGDLFYEVVVVVDPRSMELHECTMTRKHN